jgi:gamma-polyglutamate biosynthesis protein CapC
MIIEALFIGLVVGFIYYEITGLSPGGVVAPGYIALYLGQPGKIGMTILIALAVRALVAAASKYFILYGRRKLLLALLLGFCCKMAIELWIQPAPWIGLDLQSIGYIIPGLIAHELSRQRTLATLASLAVVSVVVYAILLLIR